MDTDRDLTSLTVVLSFALAVVWMQRHGRWTLFLKGLTGRLVIANSRQGLTNNAGGGTAPNFPAKPKVGQTFKDPSIPGGSAQWTGKTWFTNNSPGPDNYSWDSKSNSWTTIQPVG